MAYSNSPLVGYTQISPNKTVPRNNKIDRITIHCTAGKVSVEALGAMFHEPSKKASSNYGIGPDGRVGMYVEEKDRAWCSSNGSNDHRAVNIEVASEAYHPYAVTDAAYEKLIILVSDICKRNGITKLIWFGDKDRTLNYEPKNGEAVMTVHRWFDSKACPGDYLYNRHPEIASRVNTLLSSSTNDDKVIETGSAGMWSWRKWSSGVAECWGRKQHNGVDIVKPWGNVYFQVLDAPDNYPFAFAEYPSVNVTLQATHGNGWALNNYSTYSKNNPGNQYICNAVEIRGIDVTANYSVIGRWK